MNIKKIESLIESSKMSKVQIAEGCDISRTTLDNVLAGADAKISTIEALARVLGVSVGSLFEDDFASEASKVKMTEHYEAEIKRLQSLLDKRGKSTKVIVELDVDDDEFIKLGLKDKVLQILNK